MKNVDGSQAGQDKSRDFWEKLARHYPMPFDQKTLADTERVIALARGRGVEIADSEILDIGCGTGIYTLPLAREAAMVTGLDDSEAMAARLREAISSTNARNVRFLQASWQEMDLSAHGLAKAFDIAWVSMSPAVRALEDFARMESCARKWCVYIGWGRKRKNALMEEIFQRHGVKYGPPPGVGAAHELLTNSGREPSLDYFETSWDWEGTSQEALEEAMGYLRMHGGQPRRDLIEKVLAGHEREGKVSQITYVEEGVMVWRPL